MELSAESAEPINIPMRRSSVDSDIDLSPDEYFSSDSEPEETFQQCLSEELVEWATGNRVTQNSLTALLKILHVYHPELPKCAKTLLKTCTDYEICHVAGGDYHHMGIVSQIERNCLFEESITEVTLQINVDGLPLFKSSTGQFWPILGSVRQCQSGKPFVIGIFYGKQKPTSASEYLQDFVTEAALLEEDGIKINGKQLSFSISSVMCDAPARSFVKHTKGHGGYGGCDKCVQPGVYQHARMTFPNTNALLRTDVAFDEMEDDNHHHTHLGPSKLTELISIGMVSSFPIDYMHLVCIGVMKKLLLLWSKGPLENRLGQSMLSNISTMLVSLRSHVPGDFARRPRSLREVAMWKATELRQFLLYTGPIVLREHLAKPLYRHFMLLSVAISILLSPSSSVQYIDYAYEFLVQFVQKFGTLYGPQYITYNVHALVHLAQERKLHGPLDTISCFKYESFLGQLKRLVRKPQNPISQVLRRLSEQGPPHLPTLRERMSKEHQNGPLPGGFARCKQFKLFRGKDYVLSITGPDNIVQINNKCGEIVNLLCNEDGAVLVVVNYFQVKERFYNYPLDSTKMGVYKVRKLSPLYHVVTLDKIEKKCVGLPYDGEFIVKPLLHHS